MLRKVILTVVGHVDHGKSSLLDTIRGTTVAEREAGLITQAIGASIIPLETVERLCAPLMKATNKKFSVPGLLAIDTPGHAAFSNLRRRGGALADIAVVVVDVNEGFKPQTEEAIEILRGSKTPFVIAVNKIDLVAGWNPDNKVPVIQDLQQQNQRAVQDFETKFYNIVAHLYEKFQLNGERFDRLEDYTKQVALVPVSAKSREGIPELLMVIMGLAQRFLEQTLKTNSKGAAKGTVLEVKEDKGLGTTLDAIIYDGHIKVNDTLVIGGIDGPVVTKVKALFEPAPLAEMRDKKSKFKSVREAVSAIGVKISAKDIENVIGGMPFEAGAPDIEAAKARVQEEIEGAVIETDDDGVIIKAESIGSLEAMQVLCKERKIPMRKAMIGDVTRKDIVDAESAQEKDPMHAAILAFNVKLPEDIDTKKVKVIRGDVIYRLLEQFDEWQIEQKKKQQAKGLELLTRPCKIEILRGYVFRQSNPAVFGVSVIKGTLRNNITLMRLDGKQLSAIKGIQVEQKNAEEVERGKQAAISVPHVTVGRQVNEGDILLSFIPEEEFRKLKEFKEHLTGEEKEILREIAEIYRRENPVWGI